VCVAAVLASSIPYLWVLWDLWNGTVNPLRVNQVDRNPIYDVQARAMMHGHLWIPSGSIGSEAFVSHGHEYTYFGIFPSLLRIPVFVFTSSLDGRFFSVSIFGAWIATAVFGSLLLWRLRVLLRGNATLGWAEAASYGILLACVLVGSVLVFLASNPDAFCEDEAWSVALACASIFALVGVVERPSWRRIALCGLLVLLTNLNRSTTGYPAMLAVVLIAVWFGLGRAGTIRRQKAIPLALAVVPALVVGCAVNVAKFHMLFGVPFSDQLVYQYFVRKTEGTSPYIAVRWIPKTFGTYLDPANFRFVSVFPYITFPDAPSGVIGSDPTGSIPSSMPLLFVSGLWGVVTTFVPGRNLNFRALRILLVAAATTGVAVLVYGWIFERFVADFMPLLILASMIGLIDLWRRIGARSHRVRVAVPVAAGLLALWSFWANMGYTVSPQQTWDEAQSSNYVRTAVSLSNLTGNPLSSNVATGKGLPRSAAQESLYVEDHCTGLIVAWRTVNMPRSLPLLTGGPILRELGFLPVEHAPHTPICHALLEHR
jgi:hypothetical protein